MSERPTTFGQCIDELDGHISVFSDEVVAEGENISRLEALHSRMKRRDEERWMKLVQEVQAARYQQSIWAANLASCSLLRRVLVTYAAGDSSLPIEQLSDVEVHMITEPAFFEFAVQSVAAEAEQLDVLIPPPIHRVFLLARSRLRQAVEEASSPVREGPANSLRVRNMLNAIDVNIREVDDELQRSKTELSAHLDVMSTLKHNSPEWIGAESMRRNIVLENRCFAFRLALFTFSKQAIAEFVGISKKE